MANALKESAPQLLQHLPELPSLVLSALNQLRQSNQLAQRNDLIISFEKFERQQRAQHRGLVFSLALLGGSALLISEVSMASLGAAPLILGALGFSVLIYQLFKK